MRGWQGWALRAIVVMAVAGFLAGGYGLRQGRNQRHDLCVAIEGLKRIPFDDITDQVRQSRRFLRAHPDGIDGFTAKDIQRNIDRQIRLRARYAPQPCP